MPRTTTNPIDADRNAKERQRNQSLQKIISAIGVEVGMGNLRKQDFLEEALKQLKEYHKMKNQDFLLTVALTDVRNQLQRAQEEIVRLRGLLSTAPSVLQNQLTAEIPSKECRQGDSDVALSIPSPIFNDETTWLQPPLDQSSSAHLIHTLPIMAPSTSSEMEMPHFVEKHHNEVEMDPSAAPFAPFSLPSSEQQTAADPSPSSGSVSFGDFLHPAEVELLKDFQEPDVDLLLGDNISFFELEDAVHSSPFPVQQTEVSSELPLRPSELCYNINDLLNDPEFS